MLDKYTIICEQNQSKLSFKKYLFSNAKGETGLGPGSRQPGLQGCWSPGNPLYYNTPKTVHNYDLGAPLLKLVNFETANLCTK